MKPGKATLISAVVLALAGLAGVLIREAMRASLGFGIVLFTVAALFMLLDALLIVEVYRAERYIKRINRAAFLLTRIKANIEERRRNEA